MDVHTEMLELLGAWALDACEAEESAAVEAHLAGCEMCAAEARRLRSAAGWLAADQPAAPPAQLRHATLARARQVRAPAQARTLVAAYASQAALLDEALTQLLATAGPEAWQLPEEHHRNLSGLLEHLTHNDAMLASDIGLPAARLPAGAAVAGADIRRAWLSQTEILVRGLAGITDLDQPVRLAGAGDPHPGRLRDALVQRAFETWIHREDVGAAAGRPQPAPPAEQLRRIVELAMRLLPAALHAAGVAASVRFVLGGTGGGQWSVATGELGVVIHTDLAEFARLVAGRRTEHSLRYTATGDPDLAARVLRVAATLGCD